MAVTFDPANDGKPYPRDGGRPGTAVPGLRGILDFGSVMKARGLLDPQASPIAMSEATSTATRFDDGALFGHATSSRREPVPGKIAAESETSRTVHSAAAAANGAQRPSAEQPKSSGASVSAATGLNRLAGSEAASSGRFAEPVPDNPGIGVPATNVADAGLRAAPGRKPPGAAAGGGASLTVRAHQVATLGPVHVVARNGNDGVDLAVRVAAMAGEPADLLERRLREAAVEERTDVSSLRLNGADRPNRAGRPENG